MTADSATPEHILVTGGAGYIGSLLTGLLLQDGHRVTVVDDLLFGGESLLAYWHHPGFRFLKGDVCEPDVLDKAFEGRDGRPDKVVHLAAIVGFPACKAVGGQVATRYNVEATKRVFRAAQAAGCARFLFSLLTVTTGCHRTGRRSRRNHRCAHSPCTRRPRSRPRSIYSARRAQGGALPPCSGLPRSSACHRGPAST